MAGNVLILLGWGQQVIWPVRPYQAQLTHWGRVTHSCISKLNIISSDNGLSPGRRQAIILTNAGILLIGPLGTNFSEILIGIQTFSFKQNAFENVVWKKAAILSQPQCVNSLKSDAAYIPWRIGLTGSCNGLLPVRWQTITWTIADYYSTGLSGTNSSELSIKFKGFQVWKCPLQNVSHFLWDSVQSGMRSSGWLGLFPNTDQVW